LAPKDSFHGCFESKTWFGAAPPTQYFAPFLRGRSAWAANGEVKLREDIVDGFDNAQPH
jgi:hypothetical protein